MIILCILFGLCWSQKVGLHSELGFACWNAAFKYNFDCPVELPYNKRCASDHFMTTVYECINTYGTCTGKVDAAYRYVHDQCYYWGNATISTEEMKQSYVDNVENIKTEESITNSEPLDFPVHIPFKLFNEQMAATKTTVKHYCLGKSFGFAMLVYWSVIVAAAICVNMWKLANHEYLNSMFGRKFTSWFRYWFTMPALTGYKHYVPHKFLGVFYINAPTRGQSIIIFGFLAINVVSLTTWYDTDTPKPLVFVENSHKVARYMANRCGLIALQILPITVLFACRNNPLIVLTGWRYHTFQLYHRWCARMMTLHAVSHGTLITGYSCREHIAIWKWKNIFNWAGGNTAVYCMVIMVLFSLKAVRKRFYEVFLAVHQVLFFICLVALSVHISDYGWRESLYATIGIYVSEYFCRFYKIIRSGGIQIAHFRLVTDDVYRVTVENPRRWKFSAGQYVYLRVLTTGHIMQSHPFSVLSESKDGLEFMIKAKEGFTGSLLQILKEKPDNEFKVKAIIEGPYGQGINLHNYKSLIVMAGGVGITALYAHATSTLRDTCQKLTLIWVVKSKRHLRSYDEAFEKLISLKGVALIRVYITSDDAMDSDSMEDIDPERKSQYLFSGRPQIHDILSEHFESFKGSTAVCACGPPSFLDNARDSVRKGIRDSEQVIEYYEEGLGW